MNNEYRFKELAGMAVAWDGDGFRVIAADEYLGSPEVEYVGTFDAIWSDYKYIITIPGLGDFLDGNSAYQEYLALKVSSGEAAKRLFV